jgi:hypothetical protein
MASKKPFNIDDIIPRDLEPPVSKPFPQSACPIKPSASNLPRSTDATACLPDRVPVPQMTMPDGTLYRWEKVDWWDHELYERLPGATEWTLKDRAKRLQTVEWAKEFRAKGGSHPFKSVTQLVGRSFPVSLEIDRWSDVFTEGGPGYSFNVKTNCVLEARAHADDRLELICVSKQRGFGWSDHRIVYAVEIQTPLREESITDLLQTFRVGPPWMPADPAVLLEKFFGHFPWLG